MDEIRAGRPEDAAVLSRIALAAKRHWNYPEEWIVMWQPTLRVTADYIQKNVVYLWQSDDLPAGFIALSIDAESAEIDHLWVMPTHMGRGIGKSLLTRGLEFCRGKNLHTLWVASDPHASDFYRKMGAQLVGNEASVPAPREIPLLKFTLYKQSRGR